MVDVSALVAKLGAYSQDPTKKSDIISEMMYNPDFENRISIIPGVTDEIPMPNALIDDPLAPLKDADAVVYKTNVVKMDAEKLKVKDCILAVKVTPVKLWNTYLSTLEAVNRARKIQAQRTGVPFDPFKMPFHDFVLQKIIEKAQSSIYAKALFQGIRDEDGDSSSDLFDGFIKHINDAVTATKLVETVTGTIDATNVMQKLYLLNDALGEETKNNPIHAHLPGNVFDMLTRTLNPTINTNVIATADIFDGKAKRVNSIYLPGTNVTAFREPGLGSTGRIIFTEPDNLAFGYSVNPKDIQFEVQKVDLSLKILFFFKAGTAIGKTKKEFGALAVNED